MLNLGTAESPICEFNFHGKEAEAFPVTSLSQSIAALCSSVKRLATHTTVTVFKPAA